jgi:hypothetical protein
VLARLRGLGRERIRSFGRPAAAVDELKARIGDSPETTSMVRSVRLGTFEQSAATHAPADNSSTCWTNLVAEINRNEIDGSSHFLFAKAGP